MRGALRLPMRQISTALRGCQGIKERSAVQYLHMSANASSVVRLPWTYTLSEKNLILVEDVKILTSSIYRV